jgi:glycopeptide antibiotics resistance protein
MIIQLVGNFVLFMPFSIFLPILFVKCKDIKFYIKILLLLNVAVEITQVLLRVGSFDIDTIILNSGGAILIYILFMKWGTKSSKHLNLQHMEKEVIEK